LGGPGLGGDRVTGDDPPRLVALRVDARYLLHDLQQLLRRLGLDDAVRRRRGGRGVRPGRVGGALDEGRLHPHAAVGDRRVHLGHLHRGCGHALPERQRVPGVAVPLGYRWQIAGALVRQADAGGLAEAERPQVVVLRLLADVVRDLGHADVGGVRDDAGDGVVLARRPLGVVDELPALADLVRNLVRAHRRLAAALERGRGGDHLGRGAGLELGLHGQVGGLVHVRDVRRVVRRVLRHGQHGPGLRLDDHDRTVVRPGLLDLAGARLLGRVLQRRNDGEPQAAAVDHRRGAAARERDLLAVGADLHLLAARPAGQQRVVLPLQAGPAGDDAMAGTGKADDVGRDAALRVGPGVAGGLVDAGQAHRRDLAAGLGGHALGQHHVPRRGRVLKEAEDRSLRHAERAGQRAGGILQLGRRDLRRVGPYQVGGHGHRQYLTVGAGDAAAHRGQRDGLVPLVQRQLAIVARLHALQLDQAAGEQRQHEADREQGEPQPPGLVAAGGLATGGPGRAGRLGVGGPFPCYGGRTGLAGGSGPATLRRRSPTRVRAGSSSWPWGATAEGSAVVPAACLRPAGRVLWGHGVYPVTLIAASALDGLPTTIFPDFRSTKPRWGFGRMPSCLASFAITAGFPACATWLVRICAWRASSAFCSCRLVTRNDPWASVVLITRSETRAPPSSPTSSKMNGIRGARERALAPA